MTHEDQVREAFSSVLASTRMFYEALDALDTTFPESEIDLQTFKVSVVDFLEEVAADIDDAFDGYDEEEDGE